MFDVSVRALPPTLAAMPAPVESDANGTPISVETD
jgi:hypothetical protein